MRSAILNLKSFLFSPSSFQSLIPYSNDIWKMDEYTAQIDQIIPFLIENRDLLESHVTAAFVTDYFSRVPQEWIEYLHQFSYSQLIEISSILNQIQLAGLYNYISSAVNLSPHYPLYTQSFDVSVIEKYGMNPKKMHEVPRLAHYISGKAEQLGLKKAIDIGAGQGYLSHFLVTKAKLKVTAIEAKEHNSHESERRGKLICQRLKTDGEFENISLFVTADNISAYTNEPCVLIGLHTCGDLAASCIKLFLGDPQIKALVNVGCCYNHLTEYISPEAKQSADEYLAKIGHSFQGNSLDETLFAEEEAAGFPLSRYIKEKYPQFFLGRIPRVLAMSEACRAHIENPEATFKRFSYRSAFQILLTESYPQYENIFSVGSRIKSFNNFGDYISKAFNAMGLQNPYENVDVNAIYEERFRSKEKESAIIWSLRSILSGPIENIIILDRALYLREHGAETEIIQIFDKIHSPRNIALAAFKP
ncbi:unnamed protein product [Blepharisma stoltei]|uniref:Methyltransferase domain-containing protein n=1 Tax=Blepharisma stoltei TaxID=1481888 RepID=A0AAU9KDC8_9CILI|nr:unnamed protein product [Blepharisma stoltei]